MSTQPERAAYAAAAKKEAIAKKMLSGLQNKRREIETGGGSDAKGRYLGGHERYSINNAIDRHNHKEKRKVEGIKYGRNS